ncbi:MAG: FAD-dependent monooxygenase, partial [Hyphomicrobium sp.]
MTDNPTRFDIAISGASFAGLALARGLSQALGEGLRIAVIDRAVAPQTAAADDSRAFAIWAGAKAVLESLGVWQHLADDAEAMTTIEISDSALSDGVRPTRLTYDAKTADGTPSAYMVPSAALHRALYKTVATDAAITWIAPAEASGLTLGDYAATIALNDGRAIEASLCVAAEGRQSKLRQAAGIKTMGWGYAQRGIVATVQFERPHNGVAIQHFLPGGPFAVLPLKDNRACITWSSRDAEAARVLLLDDAAFLEEIDNRIGGRFGAITLVGKRQSWPLDVKMARDLTAKRFALIGDAAHGVHPIAGQGVNLAFRDVAALVEVLTDAARIGLDFGNGPALE